VSEPILHITSRSSWEQARRAGSYAAGTLAGEGFIHCSTAGQVLRVANNYYPGQHGLVLLVIDPARLKAQVRWEPGTDKPDELFPHVYGPIELEAVVEVLPYEPAADGLFSPPALPS
jgi:uncharacterized protein (DUF952 family)